MAAIQKKFGNRGSNVAYHGYQSFVTGEVTPEEAFEIGKETARRMWGDRYQVLVTVHLNTDNLHCHFVVNAVSFVDGHKFRNKIGDHLELRKISDQVCREHDKAVLENSSFYSKGHKEYWIHQSGHKTHRDMLKEDIGFFKYKSVLNLIWDYAREHEIVFTNPVKAIVNKRYYKSCENEKPESEDKILSTEEIECLKKLIRIRMGYKTYKGYFINGYAVLFSIETGLRAGEIPALKWSDVSENFIHIHGQQLTHQRPGGKLYYYATYTKNERDNTNRSGRKFPLTNNIREILDELKSLQENLGIDSEYIFCHEDGSWIKKDAYETCLRRMCSSLGFNVTNNHALRMSLNSNVFIPLGIPVSKRAELLGHSVETNLRHYSFATKDDLDDVCDLLNSAGNIKPAPDCLQFKGRKTSIQPLSNQILYFPENKKTGNA